MIRLSILLSFIAFIIASCGTPRTVEGGEMSHVSQNSSVKVKTAETGMDLTLYLGRLNGVRVEGAGGSAKISIRGVNSIMGDPRPLYVVNGMNLGHDYGTVYSSVDPITIDEVTVLKTADEISQYGMQGAGGVIEISLKQ